jgi:hypothetical protein
MAGELGPNGAMVERFLERLPELDLAQWADVVRSWRDTLRRTDEWADAEDAVGEAITRTGRHDAQCDLQDRLYQLFKRSPWHTNRHTPATAAGTEAAAHYLASTAAFGLLVADALPREALRALYAPFAAMIPLPELALPGEHRRGRAGRVDDLPAA